MCRARDRKLDRDVVIRILPEVFVQDPDRVAGFQREAHITVIQNWAPQP